MKSVTRRSGTRCSALASADLDRDGRPDLVVANGNAGTIGVLRNRTRPLAPLSYAQAFIDACTGVTGLAAIDLDLDGQVDLARSRRALRGG